MKKIVITGPESTGKTTLTRQLAEYFNGGLITEFARDYISNLGRSYNYNDLEIIGRKQIEEVKQFEQRAKNGFLFIDTYLIITKVWFEVVYGNGPPWVHDELLASDISLFLLCAPDLPWIKDNVRENGGERRDWLFDQYELNLKNYKFSYAIVKGCGASRLSCAINHIESFLAKGSEL